MTRCGGSGYEAEGSLSLRAGPLGRAEPWTQVPGAGGLQHGCVPARGPPQRIFAQRQRGGPSRSLWTTVATGAEQRSPECGLRFPHIRSPSRKASFLCRPQVEATIPGMNWRHRDLVHSPVCWGCPYPLLPLLVMAEWTLWQGGHNLSAGQ